MLNLKSPKKYSKSLSSTWNLNFPPIIINILFKFQAQDIDLEYLFWRFEKHIILSEKNQQFWWHLFWWHSKFYRQQKQMAVKVLDQNAETILFWNWPYVLWPFITVHKSAETIQGRKLFAEIRYVLLLVKPYYYLFFPACLLDRKEYFRLEYLM